MSVLVFFYYFNYRTKLFDFVSLTQVHKVNVIHVQQLNDYVYLLL